jgi:Protein involved in formate dehydrogenase formation
MTAPGATATGPWAPQRRRAEALSARHPFATEVLVLYVALLDVWEEAWDAAHQEKPEPPALAGWAAERVLPRVVEATAKAGPEPLADATGKLLEAGVTSDPLAAWLAGDELAPVERYLARATLRGPLQALDADAACARDPSPRGGRRCPSCGGPPQLSYRAHADDGLVSEHRHLACARCGTGWSYTGSACASCGETKAAQRTIYAERRESLVVGRGDPAAPTGPDGPMFPHVRIEGCDTCKHYLIDVDLGRDARAVPEVDELAALPLDLHAAELGLTKITPNLMGF